MTPSDAKIPGYVERLAWLATHGVDIYQFLGEEHIDDAKRYANKRQRKPTVRSSSRPKPRRSRGTIKYTGPGFSKA